MTQARVISDTVLNGRQVEVVSRLAEECIVLDPDTGTRMWYHPRELEFQKEVTA